MSLASSIILLSRRSEMLRHILVGELIADADVCVNEKTRIVVALDVYQTEALILQNLTNTLLDLVLVESCHHIRMVEVRIVWGQEEIPDLFLFRIQENKKLLLRITIRGKLRLKREVLKDVESAARRKRDNRNSHDQITPNRGPCKG